MRWVPGVVALCVALPSLTTGSALDDWMHRAIAEGSLLDRAWWDLFNFAPGTPGALDRLITTGPFPWFTLPELKLRFFRPLSSALIVFDKKVFGDAVWLAHLHSVAWYLALVSVVFALYRRVLGSVATLGAVLFALDDAHAMPVIWLANRNSVLAVLFAWLGLHAHLRWREDGWAPGLPGSFACALAALLAGETGIAALAYVVAYELVGRTDDLRARVKALLPSAACVTAFVVIYRVLGMGASGSATYIDPGAEPLGFLANAPPRILANLGGQTFGVPADLWLFLPQFRPLLVGLGVAACLAWPLAWRRWRPPSVEERRTLTWLACGAAMALVPPLATFPATRLMMAPSLGLMAVVAWFIRAAWSERGVRRLVGISWLCLSFGAQPLVTWLSVPQTFRFIAEQTTRAVTALEVKAGERIIIVATNDFAPAIYAVPLLFELKQPMPRTWHTWSMAPLAHTLTRRSERMFELRTVDGEMVRAVFEQNFRGPNTRPFVVGDTVSIEGQLVRVLEVRDGAPNAISVELTLPVEAFRFVRWNGKALTDVALPAVGETLALPREHTLFEQDLLD